MNKKRKVPMSKEYEEIYRDWIEEIKKCNFMADTPVPRVMLEMQKALRGVMQGTNK